MEISTLKLLAVMAAIAVVSSVIAVDATQDNTCNACQCHFNNVEVLGQLIEAKVATALSNEAGAGKLCIVI